MLRYGDIRLCKIKFLLRVIEKIFENVKYLNSLIEFLKFFSDYGRAWWTLEGTSPPPGGGGGSAILASPMVTIQAVVAMVTVPVATVTGLVAMETGVSCTTWLKMAVTWHVTHVTGLGDLLWLVEDPQFSILLPHNLFSPAFGGPIIKAPCKLLHAVELCILNLTTLSRVLREWIFFSLESAWTGASGITISCWDHMLHLKQKSWTSQQTTSLR